jgi:hypothetical protein
MERVSDVLSYETDNLAELNIVGLSRLLAYLGWQDRPVIMRSSALACEQEGTDLLVAITQAVGAQAYLSGDGASGYQQDDLFARRGITLVRQNFAQPVYSQSAGGAFRPGLSIVDALFEIGASATAALLEPPAA